MKAPKKKVPIQSVPSLPRIFVQIASYRDPECHHTIADLFKKAAHPGRVCVGVCWQYDPKEDAECFATEYPRAEQVRVIQYHIRDAQGAGWARMEAHSLWQGEEYTLQIQAHHRFEKGWDNTLIELLEALPARKNILTAWLPGYFPPDKKPPLNGQLPLAVVNRLGGEDDAQIMHLIKRMVPASSLKGKLLPTAMWVGNFMFTRSETLQEVPFDPYIYFWGEEINYSARLWTHGYNIYHLDRPVAYHYWDRVGVKDAEIYRNHQIERNRLSLMRNRHVLGLRAATDPAALVDIEKYSLGKARSLESYFEFIGVDLAKKTISPKARQGNWKADDLPEENAPGKLPAIFVAIASYRDPECKHTLKDLFEKARHPERIHAGICLQADPVKDKACMVKPDRPGQVRISQIHYQQSEGANWARAEAMKLWQGEEYILQIDSHMRFEPGWDEALISMLLRCPSEKPVLSTYLPNYEPPNKKEYPSDHLLRVRVRKFGTGHDPQLVHVTGEFVPCTDRERSGLCPCPFYIANFMFTRARTLQDVPIDPYFHFYGDEISYAARLWTHGYDIFQPDRTLMFHHWVRLDTMHVQYYRNTRTAKSRRSLARVRHLLGMKRSSDALALAEIDKYGLGSERDLADLWRFAGIDWRRKTLAADACRGRWNMAEREKALGKIQARRQQPRIFVQIASYRDPDCQWTIKDLFEKAAYPERVFVGIVWQTVRAEDEICFKEPYPRPAQVRVREVDAREAKGACWARNLAQKLWDGEEFTLQIDSHMRFEPGWDDMLLSMWNECENDKAVLTCYPPGFTPPNELQRDWIHGMSAKEFDSHGIFLMRGFPSFSPGNPPEKPLQGAFLSCCMFFGPGSMIKDVPYDPHLYFFGEEISMGVRLWTHGYELFHPNRLVMYHDWDRSKRPTHFSDHTNWGEMNNRSFARVRHLLGTERSSDPGIIHELDRYGLGKARTLDDYQRFSGVDFAKKTFSDAAAKGIFGVEEPAKPMESSTMAKKSTRKKADKIFVQIASYRDRECQWTIKDLFEKAKNPDRLAVGVCWQFDEKEDQDCFQVSTRPEQVRMLPVDWREAEGVCWARNQTQQMWDGETYTLQIDSHMRFMPGWDEMMVEELASCEADKPVISCNPASYTPPNNLQRDPKPTIRRVQPFTPDGNIRGKGEYIDRSPEKPLHGAFVAAGFIFSKADIIPEVPYDPYMYFDQEEISYAVRLYTHGWDVFSARKPMLYHYYNTDAKGSVRPLHWRDLHQEDKEKIIYLRSRGIKRLNHLTGHTFCEEADIVKHIRKYDLGNARTLAQYEAFSGVDFKRKLATDRALRCQFIPDLTKYRDKPIHIPEIDGAPQKNAGNAAAKGAAANTAAAQAAANENMAGRPSQNPPLHAPPPGNRKLEPGDYMPMFEATDTNRNLRGFEVHGGRFNLLCYLPAREADYTVAFLKHLHQRFVQTGKLEIWQVFLMDDTVDSLIAFREKHKLPQALWADPDHRLARAMGVLRPDGGVAPTVFLLNKNLKIIRRHSHMPPPQLADLVLGECRSELEADRVKSQDRRVIAEVPPALIVPDALSPELCRKAIHAFRTGRTFDGTVGAEEKKAYRPNIKARTDHIVGGQLLEEIDNKLSRSFFPEIKKVFGFEVAHREFYKVGMYPAEKGGFFKQHRDNFDPPLGYRRIAFTVQLNDDYDGGGLHFPEYDNHVYRPAAGSAIAFSCATLHEALPVLKGERFVLVGFVHGEEEESFRRHYLAAKNMPLKIRDYAPLSLQHYPELRQSRDFYKDWYKDNVRFAGQVPPAPEQAPPPAQAPAIIHPGRPRTITTLNGHQPRITFESKQAVVIDDFLPEAVWERVNNYALTADYEYINTKGAVARAWHVHDGFPLRSSSNLFYYAPNTPKPEGLSVLYPSQTALDEFVDYLVATQSHVEHLSGKIDQDWGHVSVTSWLYPPGTGLAMHDDGSGVYTGAYAYFLNPTWRPHWGGLLLMVEEEGNQLVYDYRSKHDQMDFYKRKWLHANPLDELLMEYGFAKCIFPRKNRIVFIANEGYHMVTRVNEQAGDNLRMSLAGFFNKKK